MSRGRILFLAWITLITMGGGGLLLATYLSQRDLSLVFSPNEISYQLLIGTGYGLIGSIVAWKIINLPYLSETRMFFSSLLGGAGLRWSDIIFISFCAGLGEEILFRFFLQNYLGVWVTSVLFVAIHGYLNPRNKPLLLYGCFMVFVIAGMGYLMESPGLYAAVSAHIVIDIVLLSMLVKTKKFAP